MFGENIYKISFFLILFQITSLFADGNSKSLINIAYINLLMPYYKVSEVMATQILASKLIQNPEYRFQTYYISHEEPADGQHQADINANQKQLVQSIVPNRIFTFQSAQSAVSEVIITNRKLYWSFNDEGRFVMNSEKPRVSLLDALGNKIDQSIPQMHSKARLTGEVMWRIGSWVIKNDIRILHCQYPSEIDFVLDLARQLKVRGHRVKTVYQDHSIEALTAIMELRKYKKNISFDGKYAKAVYKVFFGERFTEFDMVFCSTKKAIRDYRQMNIHSNIKYVPTPVNLNTSIRIRTMNLLPEDRMKVLRERIDKEFIDFKNRVLPNDSSTDLLLVLGRIDPKKNVINAIKVLDEFKKRKAKYSKSRDIKLLLLGSYVTDSRGLPLIWEEVVKRGLEEDVLITGDYIQKRVLDLLEYYKLIGNRLIYLHFSNLETFGITVREVIGNEFPAIGIDTDNAIMADLIRSIHSVSKVFKLYPELSAVVNSLEDLLLKDNYEKVFNFEVLMEAAVDISDLLSPEAAADYLALRYNTLDAKRLCEQIFANF